MLKSFTLFTIISSAFAQVPYIFGGNNATQGQFPYFGSLRYILNSAEVHGCGASILNTRWALTAAHCTDYDPSSIDELNMVVGTITLSDPGTRYKIIDIINHPSYDAEKIINEYIFLKICHPTVIIINSTLICCPFQYQFSSNRPSNSVQ